VSFQGASSRFSDGVSIVIWHLPPSLKVSMDGRRETVYSDAMIDGHLSSKDGTRKVWRTRKRLKSDFHVAARLLPVSATPRARKWAPIFHGPFSVVPARAILLHAIFHHR
jgi:hypothetical protein